MPRPPDFASRRRAQVAKSAQQWRSKRKAEELALADENRALAAEVQGLAADLAALRAELMKGPCAFEDEDEEMRRAVAEHALFISMIKALPTPSDVTLPMTRENALAALDHCRLSCLRLISESHTDASFTVPQLYSWAHGQVQLSVRRSLNGELVLRSDWELRTARSSAEVVAALGIFLNDLASFHEMHRCGVVASVPFRMDRQPQFSWREGEDRSIEAVNMMMSDSTTVSRSFLTLQTAETHALSSLWPAHSNVDGRCAKMATGRHGVADCAVMFRTSAAVVADCGGRWHGFEKCIEGVLAWDVATDGGHAVRVCSARKLPETMLRLMKSADERGLAVGDATRFSPEYVGFVKRELALLGGSA